ncbi:MAG: hypothetical protein JXB26_16920 [Candidatus Aminicenantes bacterium]|nr:hypothetical protein [Candidatus Aminicenantes bacterium]
MGKNNNLWKIEGEKMPDKIRLGLMARLNSDYENLRELFLQGFFDQMAEILGDYAVAVTPQGERLKGKDCLKRFFRNEKAKGVQTLIFEPVTFFACEAKDVVLKREDEKTSIDYTAQEVTRFRLMTEKKNNTGYISRTLCHPKTCEWHP